MFRRCGPSPVPALLACWLAGASVSSDAAPPPGPPPVSEAVASLRSGRSFRWGLSLNLEGLPWKCPAVTGWALATGVRVMEAHFADGSVRGATAGGQWFFEMGSQWTAMSELPSSPAGQPNPVRRGARLLSMLQPPEEELRLILTTGEGWVEERPGVYTAVAGDGAEKLFFHAHHQQPMPEMSGLTGVYRITLEDGAVRSYELDLRADVAFGVHTTPVRRHQLVSLCGAAGTPPTLPESVEMQLRSTPGSSAGKSDAARRGGDLPADASRPIGAG